MERLLPCRLRLAGVLLLLGLVSAAQADGCFFPPRSFPVTPEIPSQSAFVSFRDGVETLIVESAMVSDGGEEFAWVLPLPATPSTMEAVSPGLLKTLPWCLGPEVVSLSPGKLGWPLAVLMFSVLFTGGAVSKDPRERRRCIESAVVLAIVCVLALISVPSFGVQVAQLGSPAELLKRKDVGNYQTVVLRSRDGAVLADWLETNGFAPLAREALPVVDSYAREGWVFLVARLKRSGTGMLVPHPLKIVFPTASPVFPMRLTALAGRPTQVDLYVAGETPFEAAGFRVRYSDTFSTESVYRRWGDDVSVLRSSTFQTQIGHPALQGEVPNGTWMTHLSARLTPDEMRRDVDLKASSHRYARRDRIYTNRAAALQGLTTALWILVGAVPLLGWVYSARPERVGRAWLAVVAIPLAVVCVTFLWLPRTKARTVSFFEPKLLRHQYKLDSVAQESAGQEPDPARFRALVAERLKTIRNFYTDEPMREEDSPGNYGFQSNEQERPMLIVYDESGTPLEFPSDRTR